MSPLWRPALLLMASLNVAAVVVLAYAGDYERAAVSACAAICCGFAHEISRQLGAATILPELTQELHAERAKLGDRQHASSAPALPAPCVGGDTAHRKLGEAGNSLRRAEPLRQHGSSAATVRRPDANFSQPALVKAT